MNSLVKEFKEELEERKNPIDTTVLQWQSVINFMFELGYRTINRSKGFKKVYNDTSNKPNYISFQDACRLHNGVLCRVASGECEVMEFKYKFVVRREIFEKAESYKLVDRVKLQRLNKSPFVKAQNHYVKLVNEES